VLAQRGQALLWGWARAVRRGTRPGGSIWSITWRFSRDIFADGSFVEDKDHPNDIGGYFVYSLDLLRTGELTRQLNLLDPWKVWTWDPASRKPYRGYPKKQLPMWHHYRVELYPHVPGLGIGCGVLDK
jgi:hypothetical protein